MVPRSPRRYHRPASERRTACLCSCVSRSPAGGGAGFLLSQEHKEGFSNSTLPHRANTRLPPGDHRGSKIAAASESSRASFGTAARTFSPLLSQDPVHLFPFGEFVDEF